MTNHAPLVSTILPVYNGAAFLDETIRSILDQTYTAQEIIVVDDGSTDASAVVAAGYAGIHVIKQPNAGVAAARNAGAAAASGDYLCFIDQDDIWLPDKVERQVQGLTEFPEPGYCITDYTFYLSPGVPLPEWCPADWLDRPLVGYTPSALMIERALFRNMGYFDTTLPVGSDTDYFFKLKDAEIRCVHLETVLVRKRVHNANQSEHKALLKRDIMEAVRRSIHRQRTFSNPTQE